MTTNNSFRKCSKGKVLALALLALVAGAILWSHSEPRSSLAAASVDEIALGSYHTCAVTADTAVKCWGFNSSGQLGNGTTTDSTTPVDVCADATCTTSLTGVIAVAAGNAHTCVLTTTGAVKCWGFNTFGQLGNNTNVGSATPVDVCADSPCATDLTGIEAVTAGGNHTCARTTTGGVKCWGKNWYGQLGDNTPDEFRTTPGFVLGLGSGISAVSAGGDYTCARTKAGGVKCWGLNQSGQLGATTTQLCVFDRPCSTTPLDVAGLGGAVTRLAAGGSHACVRTTANGVKCWGFNSSGQLGNGTTTDSTSPVDACVDETCATNLGGVIDVAAGGSHTCVLIATGGVKCWGFNEYGQLGTTTTQLCGFDNTCNTTPVDVEGLGGGGVAMIAAGGGHTCALVGAGRAQCWGYNQYGKLGDGTIGGAPRTTPVDVCANATCGTALTDVDLIADGGVHTCARTTTGGVKCWGNNKYGALGDSWGCGHKCSTPVDVCAAVPCTAILTSVNAVAAGGDHTCAVTAVGVKCWGKNWYGQLGNGTTTNSTSPVGVCADATCTTNLTGVDSLAAGGSYGHTCARTTSGGVKCWGDNRVGQLGNGTTAESDTPTDVCADATCTTSLTGVIAVTAGGEHTCALLATAVKCWGSNRDGQLGNNTTTLCLGNPCSTTPVTVVGLSSSVAIVAAGGDHTCALTTAGGVKCWGRNASGQLGNGSTTNSTTPVAVCADSTCATNLTGVDLLATGGSHTCADAIAGGVKCWGYNYYGALGDGQSCGIQCTTPANVLGLGSGVTRLAAGGSHTCVRTTGSGVKCWGVSSSGQVGDGTSSAVYSPVDVLGLRTDTDGDGCPDKQELGTDPTQGGQRDPLNPWDYFNPSLDGINRTDDVTLEVIHYGHDVGDPLYSTRYDRTALTGVHHPWQFGPPEGLIRTFEITAAVLSYGHDCS